MLYEAVYEDEAQWVLDRLPAADHERVRACVLELEQNPFPGPDRRTPLIRPGRPTIPDAYRCHDWTIVFRVDAVFVVIEAIGRVWWTNRSRQ